MIIIPPAFLLAERTSLTNSQIGYQTYTRDASPSDVIVSSEASDETPGDAPLRPDTFEYWEPASLPATWRLDMGSPQEFDYVGIAGHTIGSNNGTVLVEYSNDGSSWTQFSDETAPANDDPILFIDDEQFARYVRLTFDSQESPQVPQQIGAIYVGKLLAMPRMIYGGHSPINLARDTVLKNALSRGGRFLGQNYRRNGVVGNASFKHLDPTWYRQYFDPFVKSARRFPFFFGWRPADYPSEVGYVWATDDIKPSNMGLKDFMEVSWAMRGIGHGD